MISMAMRTPWRKPLFVLAWPAMALAATAVAGRTKPPAVTPVANIEQVRDNLYVIKAGGGNTAALITGTGVVLVDSKLAGWGQAILDALATVCLLYTSPS